MKRLPSATNTIVANEATVGGAVDVAVASGTLRSVRLLLAESQMPVASWAAPSSGEVLAQMRACVAGSDAPVRVQLVVETETDVTSGFYVVVPEVAEESAPVTEGVLLRECLAHINKLHNALLRTVDSQLGMNEKVLSVYQESVAHSAAETDELRERVKAAERGGQMREDAVEIIGNVVASLAPSAVELLQKAASNGSTDIRVGRGSTANGKRSDVGRA